MLRQRVPTEDTTGLICAMYNKLRFIDTLSNAEEVVFWVAVMKLEVAFLTDLVAHAGERERAVGIRELVTLFVEVAGYT